MTFHVRFPLSFTLALATALATHAQLAPVAASPAKPDAPAAPVVTLDPVTVWATPLEQSQVTTTSSLATKTPGPLLTTPQSVQVLKRAVIDDQDLHTLPEALVNISGVVPAKTSETVLVSPIIRGFGAEVYIDGLSAYSISGNTTADPATLVNVDRIEVAKGPTSALFGSGVGAPLGGLINLVSKSPDFTTPVREVGLRAGSFSTFNPFIDFSQPLGSSGKAAVRLTSDYETADSYIDEVNSRRHSIQPSLAVKIDADTDLTVRGQFTHLEQLEYSGLPATLAQSGTIARDRFSGSTDAPLTTIDNNLGTAELVHRFNPDLTGTVSARYYTSSFNEYGSFMFGAPTGTVIPLWKAYLPTDVHEFVASATLLAKFATGPVDHAVLFGADYDRSDYDAAIGFAPIGLLDLATPGSTLPFGAAPALTIFEKDRLRTQAYYVQDQLTLPGRVHLLGGLRYSHLEIDQLSAASSNAYDQVTPRLAAAWEFVPGAALFAGYSEGFRAPLNFFSLTPPKPETSQSYEAGVKLDLPKPGLHGTVSTYELTRQNVSVADPSNPGFSIQTGEQRARGAEADLIWEPFPALSVLAAYAYTDAEVTHDTNAALVGQKLARVPLNSGRLAVRYRFLADALKGLEVGAGVTAASAREITLPNAVQAEAYHAFDAQVAYKWSRYTLGVSIVNLTDEKYFEAYQYLAQSVVIPAQPRSAFVTLKADF